MGEKKQPAHVIKLGNIKATIWANDSEKTTDAWFTANISRLYKSGDAGQETHSLRRDDLPVAVKAMDMAYGWMLRKSAKTNTPGGKSLAANSGR